MNAQDLKISILQLAIQGKLVEQRKEEGTAKELLEKIEVEKKHLIKEGKVRIQKALPAIKEDEVLFDIPVSWEWVRLAEIGEIVGGGTPKTGNSEFWNGGDIPWLTPADMKFVPGKYVKKGERYITEQGLKGSSARLMPKGTIIYSSRAPIGYIAIAENDLATNQGFKSLIPYEISINQYMYYCLISRTNEIISRASGTTFKEISGSEFGLTIIPLPPLEEQKRIVAKIEELMLSVKKYDLAYSEVKELNKKFPEDMQKSILQYAIQGKLVEQRDEEGTAEELYQQIQEEKAKLIKEGKIKKEKPLTEITEDEIPFEIPESWKWVRLGNLFNVSTGMTPSKTNPLFHEKGDIPWITSSQTGELRIEKANNFITRLAIESTSLKIYTKHTLLIAMYGQGKTRGQISELLIDAAINQACAALENIYSDSNLREYILYFQMYNYDMSRTGAEGSAQPNLNLDKIRNILAPLPPLEEQKRIVAKIEELMPYCQQLVK